MSEKKYKLLFNCGVVRNLIRKGFHVVDIKADKNNPDKTVFVFERTPEFEKAFSEINEVIKTREQE